MNWLNIPLILTLGLVALITGCTAEEPTPTPIPATPTPAPTGEITVKPAEVRQTIDSFGASGAWWAEDVCGWEVEKRDRIVQL